MAEGPTDDVESSFPRLADIGDDELRAGVVRAWELAMSDTGTTDLESVPWLPPVQRDLQIDDETLVDHVNDVTECAVRLSDVLRERRDADVSTDLVVTGALVHDVSKLYEFSGMSDTDVYDLLGHPYYGVHVTASAGLPVEVAHVVLSHTSRTTVEPSFLEAAIVRRADEVSATAIRAEAIDDLRNA